MARSGRETSREKWGGENREETEGRRRREEVLQNDVHVEEISEGRFGEGTTSEEREEGGRRRKLKKTMTMKFRMLWWRKRRRWRRTNIMA